MRTETTALLHAARDGDPDASARLLPLVYAELRALAADRIGAEPGVVTISATGLVHEAYLKLVGAGDWADRVHFTAVAARAMRQILTDRARARRAGKRGGPERAVTLQTDLVGAEAQSIDDVLALDAALQRLEARDAGLARVVELRFFGGLTVDETAEVVGLTPRAVALRWAKARAYLSADLA